MLKGATAMMLRRLFYFLFGSIARCIRGLVLRRILPMLSDSKQHSNVASFNRSAPQAEVRSNGSTTL